jgi:hypothetical protein
MQVYNALTSHITRRPEHASSERGERLHTESSREVIPWIIK